MSKTIPPPAAFAEIGHVEAGHGGIANSTAPTLASEFGELMEGFGSQPPLDRSASIVTQFASLPVAAYDRLMATIASPAPVGMSPPEAMQFYTQKHVDLNNAKTLQNLTVMAGRLVKKDVETIMNSK